jgi:hypothetical protein
MEIDAALVLSIRGPEIIGEAADAGEFRACRRVQIGVALGTFLVRRTEESLEYQIATADVVPFDRWAHRSFALRHSGTPSGKKSSNEVNTRTEI